MTARLNGGVSISGASAWRDSVEPSLFHYLPASIDLVLGETLSAFSATHWGLGAPFYKRGARGRLQSVVGATLSGQATPDLTGDQRRLLLAEIDRVYGDPAARLTPLALQNVRLQPLLGGVGLSARAAFPETVAFGSRFSYQVDTRDSALVQLIGQQVVGAELTANPHFSLNLVGEAAFEGEPWAARVRADLDAVWSFARGQNGGEVEVGWAELSLAELQSLLTGLVDREIVRLDFRAGGLDPARYGRQRLELTRESLQAVDRRVGAAGAFRFAPARTLQRSDNPDSGAAWPFRARMNLAIGPLRARSEASQTMDREVDFTGRVTREVPASMTLAVSCNEATAPLFRDLGDDSEPCITQAKIETFQRRLRREARAQSRIARDLQTRFALGDLSEAAYLGALARSDQPTETEDLTPRPSGGDEDGFTLATSDRVVVPADSGGPIAAFTADTVRVTVRNKSNKDLERVTQIHHNAVVDQPSPQTLSTSGDQSFQFSRSDANRSMAFAVTYTVSNFFGDNGALTISGFLNFAPSSIPPDDVSVATNSALPRPRLAVTSNGRLEAVITIEET